jgi:hypothetical protein
MRAVGSVGDKGDTIDRGRQFDPIGLLGDRGDGDLTAHAMTQGPDPPAIRRRFAVQPSSIIAVSAMIFAIVSVPIRRNIHANSGELGGHAPDAASTDCSVAFTGTNRIEGRVIASQIASASAASLLLRLTKALTVAGGISLTLCPSAFSSRPNNARSRGLPYRPHTARATGNRITLYATAACERRSAHFARAQFRALARYKRAGRIEERDGKLYATQSAGTEQRAAV